MLLKTGLIDSRMIIVTSKALSNPGGRTTATAPTIKSVLMNSRPAQTTATTVSKMTQRSTQQAEIFTGADDVLFLSPFI